LWFYFFYIFNGTIDVRVNYGMAIIRKMMQVLNADFNSCFIIIKTKTGECNAG
jgi:hypothetical protein